MPDGYVVSGKPLGYKFWHQAARDRFDERVCIMREANNVPDKAPTPAEISTIATAEAVEENTRCR